MKTKIDRESIIITVYVIVTEICEKLLEKPAQKQKIDDAEVITIAVCSALFFNSNHDKSLAWLFQAKYFSVMLSLSRYNRRVNRLKDVIEFCMEKMFDLFLNHETYITDSMPLPVCKRARALRNKKVRGREYCGYCAAKKEKFFGFRLHMVTNTNGVPVSVQILPGAFHDLAPIFEITYSLPEKSILIGDKAYNCESIEKILKDLGVTIMPFRKKNNKNQWFMCDERFIKENRHQIETSFSILSDVMGLNRLKARTLNGFLIKTYASILALIFHIVLVIN
ncbi:MAG: IS982 family transposase [Actinobacteria bacterium]|nr:IS982 family transposase [Actinomycetota bacterium]